MVKLVWRLSQDSLKSDTLYRNFMVKLVWRLSRDNTFYGNIVVKLVWRLSGNLIFHVFYIKAQMNYMISTYYGDNIIFPVFWSRCSIHMKLLATPY